MWLFKYTISSAVFFFCTLLSTIYHSKYRKSQKSLFFSACIAFTLVSCTNDNVNEELPSTDVGIITKTKAIELASTAYSAFFANNTRSQNIINVREGAVYSYCGKNTRGQESAPLYYVVNFEDDMGFALVSAQTIENPVLGVSDKGYFNPNEDCENENFQLFIESLPAYIERQSTSITLPSTPDYPLNPGVTGIVTPKIKVQWGQYGVYSDSCSNHVAGYVPTAGAMVMSYYRRPTSMPLTIHGQNNTLTLNWTEINKHTRNVTGCQENNAATTHPQISQLFAQIGLSIDADYSQNDRTSAPTNNLLNFLESLNYTCTSLQSISNVDYCNYLKNNYVLLVQGTRSADRVAHLWIMDGYERKVLSFSNNGNINAITYCHYNWGWDGKSNGYFLADVFDASQGEKYDNENWGVSSKYYDINIMVSAVKYTGTN